MSELVADYPLCRHIKTNGRRCQSPALAGQALCHFHRTLRRVHRPTPTPESEIARWRPETLQFFLDNGEDPLAIARANPRPGTLNFPPLEDAESIQLAISALFAAIAAGQIQAAHARSLLYALQIASFNVRAIPRPRDPDPGSTHATATRHRLRPRLRRNGHRNRQIRPRNLQKCHRNHRNRPRSRQNHPRIHHRLSPRRLSRAPLSPAVSCAILAMAAAFSLHPRRAPSPPGPMILQTAAPPQLTEN